MFILFTDFLIFKLSFDLCKQKNRFARAVLFLAREFLNQNWIAMQLSILLKSSLIVDVFVFAMKHLPIFNKRPLFSFICYFQWNYLLKWEKKCKTKLFGQTMALHESIFRQSKLDGLLYSVCNRLNAFHSQVQRCWGQKKGVLWLHLPLPYLCIKCGSIESTCPTTFFN